MPPLRTHSTFCFHIHNPSYPTHPSQRVGPCQLCEIATFFYKPYAQYQLADSRKPSPEKPVPQTCASNLRRVAYAISFLIRVYCLVYHPGLSPWFVAGFIAGLARWIRHVLGRPEQHRYPMKKPGWCSRVATTSIPVSIPVSGI